ncbi:hypothetical protein [Roseburia sp. 499]|uniref:hypothetical protein n=1 Tax=Roseburia sp. 499 TaxID=1261634 RepID=UPI000951A483|nr:hypothetical protein [Roseburia sp. 499]WVK69388.1 hypothetical protein BIV20_13635 [Roseburia sp. 499]
MNKQKRKAIEKEQKQEFLFHQYIRIEQALSDALCKLSLNPFEKIGIQPFFKAGKLAFYQVAYELDLDHLGFDSRYLQARVQGQIDFAQEYGHTFYVAPYFLAENSALLRTLRIASVTFPEPDIAVFRCYVVHSKQTYRLYLSENAPLDYLDIEWRDA